jgi:hypothetical protein
MQEWRSWFACGGLVAYGCDYSLLWSYGCYCKVVVLWFANLSFLFMFETNCNHIMFLDYRLYLWFQFLNLDYVILVFELILQTAVICEKLSYVMNPYCSMVCWAAGCWLATFYKLGWPIYKPDGHQKPNRFGSKFSPVGAGAGLISHLCQFFHGSDSSLYLACFFVNHPNIF